MPNPDYWDKARVPKLDKMVLIPMPEVERARSRRCGPARWTGSRRRRPTRSTVADQGAGFKIVTNVYPHNWTWHLRAPPGSPWNDIRVRKAANLAIDREGMKELLAGLMIPAKGFLPPGHQVVRPSEIQRSNTTRPRRKKLLAEAGYRPDKPMQHQGADLGLGLRARCSRCR